MDTRNFTGNIKLKVKFRGEKYYVRPSDVVKIDKIKLILYLKRLQRRCKRILPQNCKIYLVLTLLWFFFGMILYYVSGFFVERYTVKDVIWELKDSYFTSVVLVLLGAGCSQILSYKGNIREQRFLYVETMKIFDQLFVPFIWDELDFYSPYYNRICLLSVLEHIKHLKSKDCHFSSDDFKIILECIFEHLSEIEIKLRSNTITWMWMDQKNLENDLRNVKQYIIGLKAEKKINFKTARFAVGGIAYRLFDIIEYIGQPWRKDIGYDKEILTILTKYEEYCFDSDIEVSILLYGNEAIQKIREEKKYYQCLE